MTLQPQASAGERSGRLLTSAPSAAPQFRALVSPLQYLTGHVGGASYVLLSVRARRSPDVGCSLFPTVPLSTSD